MPDLDSNNTQPNAIEMPHQNQDTNVKCWPALFAATKSQI